MVDGYDRATARFQEACFGTSPVDAFIPLFEALNWAASIDERMGFPALPELRGLRFARNRVHHQYADALWLDESGAQLPTPLPAAFFEWRWRSQLPPGRNSNGEEDYRNRLADVPARLTLDRVWAYLTARP
jgi:hypothetical protein